MTQDQRPDDPRGAAEWQEAVECAEFLLLLESARLYGLITGGPDVDVDRCEEILRRGKAVGIRPRGLDTGARAP